MLRKDPRILFFHTSVRPTAEEQAFAESLSTGVMFRNANVKLNGSLEPCDGVAGEVPDEYRAKFPVVNSREDAIAAREGALTAADNEDAPAPTKAKPDKTAVRTTAKRPPANKPKKPPHKKGWAANK